MIFCLNLLISAPTFYTDSFDIPLINLCFSGEQQTQTHLRFICMYVYIYIYIYMVFTTEGLFEVALESWPE